MQLPNYRDGSIVNLMSSIVAALGGKVGLYSTLPQLPPARLEAAGDLILIVVDGLGYNYLLQHGEGGCLHAHLKGRITSVVPATTASAITTFLTGDAPQQHGLTGWFTYFRELGAVVTVLPFTPRYGRTPLSVAGISAADFFRHTSVFEKVSSPSYNIVPNYIRDSDFNVSHSGPATRLGYADLNGFFQRIFSCMRVQGPRRYIYAYWPEFDSLAHSHGVSSPRVAEHFAELDARFASFLREADGSGATVIVTADHGIVDPGPSGFVDLNQHPELTDCLVLPLCGEPRLGYAYVKPDSRERFEHLVRRELAAQVSLYRSAELLDAGWFGLGQPHPQLKERIGHYALVMQGNYAIRDRLPMEADYQLVGVHGGVSEDEMFVPLVVKQC